MKDKEENRRHTFVWQGFMTQYFAVRISRKIQNLIGGAIQNQIEEIIIERIADREHAAVYNSMITKR